MWNSEASTFKDGLTKPNCKNESSCFVPPVSLECQPMTELSLPKAVQELLPQKYTYNVLYYTEYPLHSFLCAPRQRFNLSIRINIYCHNELDSWIEKFQEKQHTVKKKKEK